MSKAGALVVVAVGCSGGGAPASAPKTPAPPAAARDMAASSESSYGPLEVGADFETYRRVTDEPFLSTVHGNRWVHVYANEVGAAAYLAGTEIPVGTIVVKASWQDDGGRASAIRGPTYVMEKRAPGYAPDHDDWYVAIHWESPPASFGAPLYWRGKSPRVEYCYDCHDGYDRGLGGLVPSSQLPR
jgi:hypothetical protein